MTFVFRVKLTFEIYSVQYWFQDLATAPFEQRNVVLCHKTGNGGCFSDTYQNVTTMADCEKVKK